MVGEPAHPRGDGPRPGGRVRLTCIHRVPELRALPRRKVRPLGAFRQGPRRLPARGQGGRSRPLRGDRRPPRAGPSGRPDRHCHPHAGPDSGPRGRVVGDGPLLPGGSVERPQGPPGQGGGPAGAGSAPRPPAAGPLRSAIVPSNTPPAIASNQTRTWVRLIARSPAATTSLVTLSRRPASVLNISE